MNENELPPHMRALVEAMRSAGADVSVTTLAVPGVEGRHSVLEVQRRAAAAMKANGFDKHRVCSVLNAIGMIQVLVRENAEAVSMAIHMGADHRIVSALDWAIAAYTFAQECAQLIRKAETDTSSDFGFISHDEDADSGIDSILVELAALRAKAVGGANGAH